MEEIFHKQLEGDAYKAAYAKADKASIVSKVNPSQNIRTQEDYSLVFGDDNEELRKSSRQKQDEVTSSSRLTSLTSEETQEKKIIFTELEEFVRGLQLDKEAHHPVNEDMFVEYLAPNSLDDEMKDIDNNDDGQSDVKNSDKEEPPAYVDMIREAPVGKGLSGALKILKDRGTLKETAECGGRNMEKKKSKVVGVQAECAYGQKEILLEWSDQYGQNVTLKEACVLISHRFHGKRPGIRKKKSKVVGVQAECAYGQKEILLEWSDQYGQNVTLKEACVLISHRFHGKRPGIRKQKRRMRRYEEELKVKRMMNSDTQSQPFIERMRQVQARLRTPCLILSQERN